jgi:hypothetical protein
MCEYLPWLEKYSSQKYWQFIKRKLYDCCKAEISLHAIFDILDSGQHLPYKDQAWTCA